MPSRKHFLTEVLITECVLLISFSRLLWLIARANFWFCCLVPWVGTCISIKRKMNVKSMPDFIFGKVLIRLVKSEQVINSDY